MCTGVQGCQVLAVQENEDVRCGESTLPFTIHLPFTFVGIRKWVVGQGRGAFLSYYWSIRALQSLAKT